MRDDDQQLIDEIDQLSDCQLMEQSDELVRKRRSGYKLDNQEEVRLKFLNLTFYERMKQ